MDNLDKLEKIRILIEKLEEDLEVDFCKHNINFLEKYYLKVNKIKRILEE